MDVLGEKTVQILRQIPDPRDRAFIAARIVRLIYAQDCDVEKTEGQTAEQIADWIDQTWPTETVRAKHAQKISRMIRAGDWKTPE